MGDALAKAKKIKYVAHHHEQAASFAAEGYARSKNDVGCCFVTTGPGGTNAVTGISSAWIELYTCCICSRSSFFKSNNKKNKKDKLVFKKLIL